MYKIAPVIATDDPEKIPRIMKPKCDTEVNAISRMRFFEAIAAKPPQIMEIIARIIIGIAAACEASGKRGKQKAIMPYAPIWNATEVEVCHGI